MKKAELEQKIKELEQKIIALESRPQTFYCGHICTCNPLYTPTTPYWPNTTPWYSYPAPWTITSTGTTGTIQTFGNIS